MWGIDLVPSEGGAWNYLISHQQSALSTGVLIDCMKYCLHELMANLARGLLH